MNSEDLSKLRDWVKNNAMKYGTPPIKHNLKHDTNLDKIVFRSTGHGSKVYHSNEKCGFLNLAKRKKQTRLSVALAAKFRRHC